MVGHVARAGAVTLLLVLGAAACGGDDSSGLPQGGSAGGLGGANLDDDAGGGGSGGEDPGGGGGGDGGSGGGSGDGGDACSLLQVSEIEAAFGDHGAVADGEVLGYSCSWEVGDPADEASGIVGITSARSSPSSEEALAEIRGMTSDPVEIEGLGDEAMFTGDTVWFRSGEHLSSVTAWFGSDSAGMEEKLTDLARHMLDRI